MHRLHILIPAYRPSEVLIELVEQLSLTAVGSIVVVNDGSDKSQDTIFDRVAKVSKVTVLKHAVNLGKGAALKTGLNYLHAHFPDAVGAITADADGQHRKEDILAVGEQLLLHPAHLIMGVRSWSKNMPWRSRFGNNLTQRLFYWMVGQRLSDTQSGLRGIPQKFIPILLKIPTHGYDFELDMLMASKQTHYPIIEQKIATIYIENNQSSHFNPLIDSLKIYFVLFRYMLLSLGTACIDYLAFIVAQTCGLSVLASQTLGRTCSIFFNYPMAKQFVFFSAAKNTGAFPKFVLLVIISGTISYGLIEFFMYKFSMAVLPAKVLSELIVYLGNFAIQRDFIFFKRYPV